MTDYLFARPSLLYSVASLMDLGAQLHAYNESPTPAVADARALRSDWISVGEDLKTVLRQGLDPQPA